MGGGGNPRGLLVADGQVGFARPEDTADPDQALEAAVYSAQTGTPLSHGTLADMGQTRDPFEWTERKMDAFARLLGAGAGLRDTWAALGRPELSPIGCPNGSRWSPPV